MKRILSAALALTLAASLTACGAKDPAVQDPEPDPSDAPTANMHNPVHYGTAEQVQADTGFLLSAPANATDVQFSSIEGTPPMAQMSYTVEGTQYLYRILADDTSKDISGLHYDWSSEAPGEVGGLAAELFWIEGQQGHITWTDGSGVRYDLSMDSGAAEKTLTDVAGRIFCGEAERDYARDFSTALSDFCKNAQPGTAGSSLRSAAFTAELADLFTEWDPEPQTVIAAVEGFIETLEDTQMSPFSVQLNGTLNVFRELAGEHGGDLISACGYTPEHGWNEKTLEPLFRAMSVAVPWDAIYAGIVENYVTAAREGYDRQAMRDKDLNDLAADVGDTPLETLGYTIDDLDGDGIRELAIGTISDNDFLGKLILDLYTLDEAGAPKLLFRSRERDRLYSEGSNIFANVGSSGAADSFSTTLELKNGELLDLEKETPAEYYTQLDLTPLSKW